jgi:hypothetical protein
MRFAVLLIACLVICQPGAFAQSYPKIEASFSITNLSTDPFDYTVTDVRVQIQQPDSTVVSLPAFFDGGTTWRVRHTPALPGLYQISGITLNNQPKTVSSLQPGSWIVSGSPNGPGFVKVDPANTNRFITTNGRRYFPAGQDVAWDTSTATNVVGLMAKLGGTRENWSRIWMDHWDNKNLEWPKVGAFGQLSLTVAQKWDGIAAAAEQAGVFFQITLQHHGQYSTTVDPNWPQNPYNTTNGGFLADAKLFFTDATAKSLTKRKYRYIVARWGYSPAVMAWELFNEVQYTDAAIGGQWTNITAWHDEMAQFIRSQDNYHHLITTSSQLDQQIWNQCDYYQHHDYPSADVASNLRNGPGVPAGQPIKPIFAGECGIESTPRLGVNGPLWGGLMAGQSGAAQPWWWDQIDAEKDYGFFRAVGDFAKVGGLAEQDSLAKSAPHVTCPVSGSLAFAPGGGWGDATQDTFTVGDVAPDGIGTLPSYLQGNYHRSMTPNGYSFLVNYGVAGTFSVQILQIAASGAGLTIYLDGTATNSISFPATISDTSTNFTLSINVPAGAHTVKLWDPGLDWLLLGNITLNPYASMLGAYQIGTTNFAALWIWHRTNLYYINANVPLSGTVPIAGLQPGNYNAAWWDTSLGVTISNFSFTVSGTNAVTLPTPSILRSVALYAGPPAQATISAATLTQTLGTNSPPVIIPVTMTNSGGLPLSWSLSVTGQNTIAYYSLNSAQPAGPLFAWKDISGVGRDLTTNFTPLTGKNALDEGIAGPIDIGFGFPFYSGGQTPDIFTQLYVSPNGFVTFSPFAGDTSTNQPLPSPLAPSNCIAFFWDDLDLSAGGRVYADTDPFAGAFTLQFQDARIKGTATNVTCQLILKTSGEILLQYKTLGVSNSCTVGVQNAAKLQGFSAAYNQTYLQSGMAVRINPRAWLGISANAALLPKNKADTVNVTLNPAGAAYGTYRATMLVRTSDTNVPLTILPIELDVTPIATWRQTHFGTACNCGNAADNADPDQDGLINIVEYAFNLDPLAPSPYPISYELLTNHLTLTFKRSHPPPYDIGYLFETTSDLLSGLWNSGPAYTSESVTDNLDGTETVIVTDLAGPPSPVAHYLRVRIQGTP